MADIDDQEFQEAYEEALQEIAQERKRQKNDSRLARRKRKREYKAMANMPEDATPGVPRWKRVKVADNIAFDAGGFYGLEELEFDGPLEGINFNKIWRAPFKSGVAEQDKTAYLFEPDIGKLLRHYSTSPNTNKLWV